MTKAENDADGFKPRRLVYAGQRHEKGKIWHLFLGTSVEGSPKNKEMYSYKVKGNANAFIIGLLYDVPMNDDDAARLINAEPTDYHATEQEIAGWSIQDTAARTSKHMHGTHNRLIKERREAWKEGMRSLRYEYKNMSAQERRAMRVLVIEWLEER
jgi:hypothetical protein